jgi:uncharacterized cupin superfamily protein
LHRHIDEDEIFHIISGTVRFVVDGKELTAGPGDTVRGPKNIPHTYRVESSDGARMLSITGRQQFEHFVRALGRQPTREGLPTRPARQRRSKRKLLLRRPVSTVSKSWARP